MEPLFQDVLNRHLGETGEKEKNDAYLERLTDQIEPCTECGKKHEPMISCSEHAANEAEWRQDTRGDR